MKMPQPYHIGAYSNSMPPCSMAIVMLLIKVTTRSEVEVNCLDGKGINNTSVWY